MTYKKLHLITDEFYLIKSIKTFKHIINKFSEKEICYANFGHYPRPQEDQSLRIRIEFSNEGVETKALGIVKQLIGNGYVIDVTPDSWVELNPSPIVKNAITLSSDCAVTLAKLDEFKKINQSNPLPTSFSLCFFYKLFQEFGINLGFNTRNIESTMKSLNLLETVENGVNAIKSTCIPFKSSFSNWTFLERFIHMLDNNLLIFPWIEVPYFWKPFYNQNKINSESPLATIHRFRNELKNL